MAEQAQDMRWWGWGTDREAAAHLPAPALELLRSELELRAARTEPVEASEVHLPAARSLDGLRSRLGAAVGSDAVRDDHLARLLHCGGKGYVDLARLRRGRPEGAPDLVVYPDGPAQVASVLAACADAGVAVVPFGGGTSVVGGLAPLAGDLAGVVSLDMRRLVAVEDVDRMSLSARVQGGIRAPALERALGASGLTLGHFPQSYLHVSVGGCVATRSAGQASTGYGRIEDLVLGLRCETPSGTLELPSMPATAAGPDLRQLVVGSEGTLGVITEVTLRLHRAPAVRRYEGAFFRSFAEGVEALRILRQEGPGVQVARLSDEEETRLTLSLAGRDGALARLGSAYLRRRGADPGCVAILGWEGEDADVERRRSQTRSLLSRHGAILVGERPGRAWARSRFQGPYLRDELMSHGVLVETLETATTWPRLDALHRAVAGALRESLGGRGTPARVGCHVSHLYESGASLYFTFLARAQEGEEVAQWQAAKVAASEAIVAEGATITHHHAVGRDHVRWLGAEDGPLGIGALRALKRELDPVGIMNPGKVVGAESA